MAPFRMICFLNLFIWLLSLGELSCGRGCDLQSTYEAQLSKFKKLFSILNESDVYVPIEFRKYVTCSNKNEFRWLVSKLQEKRFPYILQDFKLYHYSIPSKGPREAVHFVWKQCKSDSEATPEQRKMISSIHEQEK